MLRVILRSLLSHKLRLLLTAVSVILGIAFVSGTFVFTDTLRSAYRDVFETAYSDVAVQVRTQTEFAETELGDTLPAPIPEPLADLADEVDGVAEVYPDVQGYAAVVGKDGEVVGTTGPPNLGLNWTEISADSGTLRITDGQPPRREGEIAVDARTAEQAEIGLGDTVRVLVKGPPIQAEVVGIARFGETDNLGGATMVLFDTATAQKVLLEPGQYSSLSLTADPGVSDADLARRVQERLPAGYEAVTGETAAAEDAEGLDQFLSLFNTILLVFAGIALFVGVFLIVNTFSILVAQRTRELALLRIVGANRAQVRRSVLGEAFAVGLVSSVVALVLGLGLAALMRWLLDAFVFEVPDTGLVLAARTVIVALVLGTLVTMGAAFWPAQRASRIAPMVALREEASQRHGSLRRRTLVGLTLMVLGITGFIAGFATTGGAGAALVGGGAALVLLAVTALAAHIARPVVRFVGSPLRRAYGMIGRLGERNATRNPRRTTATAAALMIGLALVTALGVLGQSGKASFDRLIERSLGADVMVNTTTGIPFSTSVAGEVREVEGVGAVSPVRVGRMRVDGSTVSVSGVDPDTYPTLTRLRFVDGSADTLAQGGLLVDEDTADAEGLRVGQSVPVEFARTGDDSLRLSGIFERNQFAGTHLVSLATYEQNFSQNLDSFVFANAASGANPGTVYERVKSELEDHPNVTVTDQSGMQQQARQQIDLMLGVIYGLLAMAILIAVLGIVNTLALSVLERTREIGLLRAVGMSRRQLRRMVRLESVIIAVFGALLGLGVGLAFGVAIQQAIKEYGIDLLEIPVGLLLLFLVLAVIVGVLAALWPARRAARLDVLRAIAYE